MSKQQTHTVKQLSKQTSIPPSSIRYYIESYGEFLHGSQVEGTKTVVYDSECLEILKDIRKAQKDGKKKHQILEMLNKKHTPIYDGGTKSQSDNKQTNNKLTATNKKQGDAIMAVMQTAQTFKEFGELQREATSYYKELSIEQDNIIKKQTKLVKQLQLQNSEQLEGLKAVKKELQQAKRPSLLNTIFKAKN